MYLKNKSVLFVLLHYYFSEHENDSIDSRFTSAPFCLCRCVVDRFKLHRMLSSQQIVLNFLYFSFYALKLLGELLALKWIQFPNNKFQ